ncbi:hypothetical protein MTZ49_05830 [Entomomonas sp. E2T0]|uniref:tetratricopeptide repeat protein n=1 Tax=Entomomonas sp. E2T0 TaxID=2930213 RepID=UPI00222830B9|nr:hypothetical protein [Entomomonas sp. E2T0]UYZ85073.1 hypothetical protein MTZ49_05830 [Entomomonas sp. E2T0]
MANFIVKSIVIVSLLNISVSLVMAACAPIVRQPVDPKWLNYVASLKKQGEADNGEAYYQLYLLLPWEVIHRNYCAGFNYNKFDALKAAAQMGHVLAQYELGNFYQYHNFFLISRYHIFSRELWDEYKEPQLPDIKQGESWQEYKERNNEIFIAIDQHPYKKIDERSDAITWYKKSIEQGYVPAIYQLGKFYTSRNPEEALSLLAKAVEQGSEEAKQELIKIKKGDIKLSYQDDEEKTFKWLWQQSQKDNLYAVSQLITFQKTDKIVQIWLKEQTTKNNEYVISHLAESLIKEEYFNIDFAYLAPFIYKLAINDNDLAQLWMANYYEKARDDRIISLKWLKKAIALGNEKALKEYDKYNRVRAVMSESIVLSGSQKRSIDDFYGEDSNTKSPEIAKDRNYRIVYYDEQLVIDAVKGNMDAEYQLGLAYEIGEWVKEDEQQAIYWYKKAAEQGNRKAIFRLVSSFYDNPFSSFYNNREATIWIEKRKLLKEE